MRRVMLTASLLLLIVVDSDSQGDDPKRKVPHQDDETSLIRIKANPEKIVGMTAIICGGVKINDYYNFTYDKANKTHYSLSFLEAGKLYGDLPGERANLYLEKTFAADVIEEITKVNEDKVHKLIRAKVTLVPWRFQKDKQWNMFEVTDIQLVDSDTNEWLPWAIEVAKEKAKEEEQKQKSAEREVKTVEKPVPKAAVVKPKSDAETAAAKMSLAKTLLEKNKVAGRKRLQEIVDKYPNTPSAEAAKELLDRE